MDDDCVLVEVRNGHARLTLNRPERHNPLDATVVERLDGHLRALADDRSVRVVTLRGAGPSFCAGADLKHFLAILDDAPRLTDFMHLVQGMVERLENFPRPVLAVVHGFALAGGLELLLACDLALAAEDAQIGDQHANYGLIPGAGSTQRLPRILGERRAKELMYLGTRVSGREAAALGLVNKSVPAEQLDAEAERWVAQLLEKSPRGLGYMKDCLRMAPSVPPAAGLAYETAAFLEYARLPDLREGLQAFQQKRKPRFLTP
jgi:enoyl-CoA hydratase/carnithine racemase